MLTVDRNLIAPPSIRPLDDFYFRHIAIMNYPFRVWTVINSQALSFLRKVRILLFKSPVGVSEKFIFIRFCGFPRALLNEWRWTFEPWPLLINYLPPTIDLSDVMVRKKRVNILERGLNILMNVQTITHYWRFVFPQTVKISMHLIVFSLRQDEAFEAQSSLFFGLRMLLNLSFSRFLLVCLSITENRSNMFQPKRYLLWLLVCYWHKNMTS